uniref:mRNA (guanine-N(7))-methyltransferase n=1 Tax=viral metagenome TaxID=1070528 RepID=A0A6C0IIS8_9ZZZZ
MANLNNLIKVYLDDLFKVSANTELELEVKFGTRGIKPIDRLQYGQVIQGLLSHGFTAPDSNKYLLRIQNEYTDITTGEVRLSNLRTEISGLHNVQIYCKSNRLDGIVGGGVAFIQKEGYKQNHKPVYPVNVDDFNFRLALSSEHKLTSSANMVKDLLEKWNDNKKTFRYLNRYSLKHPDFPFIVDLSIVKESKKQGKSYVPEYNFQDSGVLLSTDKYEIEIECMNSMVGIGTPFSTPTLLQNALNQVIKYVLAGLQETNYPVAYSEQKLVLYEYMQLLWHPEKKERKPVTERDLEMLRVVPKNFVGPSSYTLEVQNIMPLNGNMDVPNIRLNYTVTDKADGDRKLLYIAPASGKIYLINTNMAVQFTGAVTRNKDLFNTLLDGEHILYNKDRVFINLYTAFDIYYLKGENLRMKAFIPTAGTGTGTASQKDNVPTIFRLPVLVNVIKKLLPESVVKNKKSATPLPSPLRVEHKTFYSGDENQTIFQGCDMILQKVADGLFEYHTDGLIFTPAHLGVSANKVGETVKPLKTTWEYSFKWKPVEQNTIDFLISVKKMANGSDYVGNKFETGINVAQATQLTQYKTVILRVGFDENNPKHGYINPCQDVIEDKVPVFKEDDDEDSYKPVQFYPTQPSDAKAGIANILLEPSQNDEKVMLTSNKEVIEDNMIVEFSYDVTKEEQWRWQPLKVRYDKTTELRAGIKNFGNAYHVANSNWRTIHNPITKEMITLGVNIPEELTGDDDVYYNRTSSKTSTQALRDFHNRYVKKSLLNSVAKRGDTLIDLAVGKGGDFPKWISANLRFVFGIDISKDNIQNRLDGACARFLKNKRNFKNIPDALFVNGSSSVNIRTAQAMYSEKDKQITKAVFGEGAKDAKELGQGVYKEYGIGKDGFDICSIQFAIHYMFETNDTLQNFLRNVSEVTKVGGYFIGTSYDGKVMFNMLKQVKEDESTTIVEGTGTEATKIWEVTKRYNRNEFEDNVSCLGYGIDVYQESINKTFREYLVNYDYLTQLMENYGFVLLRKEELKGAAINQSTGLFTDLFMQMNNDLKRNPRLATEMREAANMSAGERQISFLNRYFIYKKVRKVDSENVFLGLTNRTALQEKAEEEVTKRAQEEVLATVKDTSAPAASAVKVKGKTKKVLKLVADF